MLLSTFVPFLIWKLAPDAWHIYLEILAAVLLLGVLGILIRYIVLERARDASVPSRGVHQWPSGWTVLQFSRGLLTYLKVAGWKVQAAQASGPDRLLLGLQRERQRIALMCLRPGHVAGEADWGELEAMRQRLGTLRSVLVTDRGAQREPAAPEPDASLNPATPAPPLVITYAGLPDLMEHLEGGAEEQRRDALAEADA